ncbi:DUF3667 domain-containing protein [Thalassotalea piscium]
MNATLDKKDIEHEETQEKTCENCHAKVVGTYCGECGQSTESSLKYFWSVILHLLDDIFSFDSRASRTLFPLLLNPGFLTKEYIAGRRVHYVPPLRLYLFISIIFFLSLKFFIDNGFTQANEEKGKVTTTTQQIDKALVALNTLPNGASEELLAKITENKAQLNQYKDLLSENQDKEVIQATIDLAKLELIKINTSSGLSTTEQKKYDELKEYIRQFNANNTEAETQAKKEKKRISISNNADGSFSIASLSEKNNKILQAKADELETKANELLTTSPEKLIREVVSKLPQIMFVVLPLFALLLKVIYLFSNRLYMEHLTVALHSHSFIFLAILIIEIIDIPLDALTNSSGWVTNILQTLKFCLLCWIPIYLFAMQKRVYKQGYVITFIKYFLVGILYILLLTTAAVVAFVWGLLSI